MVFAEWFSRIQVNNVSLIDIKEAHLNDDDLIADVKKRNSSFKIKDGIYYFIDKDKFLENERLRIYVPSDMRVKI